MPTGTDYQTPVRDRSSNPLVTVCPTSPYLTWVPGPPGRLPGMANKARKRKVTPTPAPVPDTPTELRIGVAALFGLGVGALATPLDRTVQAALLIGFLGAGLLWIFSHPYRRDVRTAVESRGHRYATKFSQLIPLLPLWFALMLVPGFELDNWFAGLGIAVVGAAYSWLIIPFIDGTKNAEKLPVRS